MDATTIKMLKRLKEKEMINAGTSDSSNVQLYASLAVPLHNSLINRDVIYK